MLQQIVEEADDLINIMKITFKDSSDKLIPEEQISKIDTYFKVYSEDGQVKQKEKFYKGEFKYLMYYKDANETHEQIMSNLFVLGKYISIVEKEAVTGGYTLERSLNYDEKGEPEIRINELFDANYDCIAHEWISDLISGVPDYHHTVKYFFDRSVNPNYLLFECIYDEEDGKFDRIDYNNYHIDYEGHESMCFSNSPKDTQELRALTGISQQLMDYYLSPRVIPNF